MKPDYVRPVLSLATTAQVSTRAQPAAVSPDAFNAVLSGVISNKAILTESSESSPLTSSENLSSESLESRYRTFAASFAPRRDPPGCIPSVEINARILRDAEADPNYAMEALGLYVYQSFGGPLLDITDPDNIRYTVTGELVTPQSIAYYAKTAAVVKKELADLYQREKNLGTPPAQALKKVFCLLETQPRAFLEMSAW